MALTSFVYPRGLAQLLAGSSAGVWDKEDGAPWKVAWLLGPGYTPRPHHITFGDAIRCSNLPREYVLTQGWDAAAVPPRPKWVDGARIDDTDVSLVGTEIRLTGQDAVFSLVNDGALWVGAADTGLYGVMVTVTWDAPSEYIPAGILYWPAVEADSQVPIVYFYDDGGAALDSSPTPDPVPDPDEYTIEWGKNDAGITGTIIEVNKI